RRRTRAVGHLHALRLRARRDPRHDRDARRVDRVPRSARDRRDVEDRLPRARGEPAGGDRGNRRVVLAGARGGGLIGLGGRLARGWKFWALLLGLAVMLSGKSAATSWPPPLVPLGDEDLLALNLSGQGCVGVVAVLKRAFDSGQDD